MAVSHNFDTARIKAAFSRGISVVPQEQEAISLAATPIGALPIDEENRIHLHCGEFAASVNWQNCLKKN